MSVGTDFVECDRNWSYIQCNGCKYLRNNKNEYLCGKGQFKTKKEYSDLLNNKIKCK